MALTYDSSLVNDSKAADDAPVSSFVRMAAIASVLGGLTFNLFLCFVNTRVMGISDSHVMLGEMAVTGTAFLAALDRRAGLYLFLTIFITYMFFLFALRHQNDIKAIRDVLNPVIFYVLGTRIKDIRLADRLALVSSIIVLIFAAFEYFLLDIYLDWFNVLGYYISRGTVSLQESYGATRGLFISGIRPEPRSLLPFLGQQRVSSVFLEPVSMGNFGAIIYAWGLFRSDCKYRWFLIVAALIMIISADARFGLGACIVMTVLVPFFRLIPRPLWAVVPFLMLSLFAAYGLVTGVNQGPDDFAGRLASTAHLITTLPQGAVLGYEAYEKFTADSGFAYTLTQFGIVGFVGLWTAFVMLPCKDARGWQFHSMMIVYLILILIISNSFYSVKTAALMFFMLGTANAVRLPETRSIWSRLLGNGSREINSATDNSSLPPRSR
jgi:putative polymerase